MEICGGKVFTRCGVLSVSETKQRLLKWPETFLLICEVLHLTPVSLCPLRCFSVFFFLNLIICILFTSVMVHFVFPTDVDCVWNNYGTEHVNLS